MHRRMTRPHSPHFVRSAHGFALLTALMGVVNLLSVTTPALRERVALLRDFLPLEVRDGSHLAATLCGFFLLVQARRPVAAQAGRVALDPRRAAGVGSLPPAQRPGL